MDENTLGVRICPDDQSVDFGGGEESEDDVDDRFPDEEQRNILPYINTLVHTPAEATKMGRGDGEAIPSSPNGAGDRTQTG